MDKRDLAASAVEALAEPYPTPATDGPGSASFYNATSTDVALDQIDPQLESSVNMETDQGDAGLQGRTQIDGQVDSAEGIGQDESYPESHLRALKAEDNEQAAAYAEAQGGESEHAYGSASLEQVADQDGDQGQQHQQGQEHGQHQQQSGRTDVSADELQLAAQLSQGLAPMMREANARREEEYQNVGDDSTGNLQGQDEAAALRVAAAAVAAADGVYGAQDVSYHPDLSQHPDVQGHPAYADASQGVAHIPSSLQMAQIAQQSYSSVDHIPPRKRSKVSRACDACRRKKIKCDSVSETEQCSNCRRSHVECLFSRVPQKRGPSKGYIKELADRINSIEGKLGSQTPTTAEALELLGAGSRRESAEAYPGFSLNENAKRPFANITGETPQSSPASNRHAAWASTPRPLQPYQTPTGSTGAAATTRTPYSAVSLAPQPQVDPETPASLSRQLTDMERLLPLAGPADHESQELDEAAFNTYLMAIHPTLPFLATSRSRILELLAQCPQLLQDAFVVAIRAAADSLEALPTPGVARVASALLAQWEAEGAPHTPTHDLVHLQTLLLLAIEADAHGPTSLKGQHGGLSKTTLLSRAVAVAYGMDLSAQQLGAVVAAASASDAAAIDPNSAGNDSETRLGLRAWWALVVLDRWNAVALAKPLLIPERSVVLSPGLRHLLGETAFQFTQLSYLLGSSISTFLLSPRPISPPPTGINLSFGEHLNLGLEIWRANLPDSVTDQTDPLVHLAYWHYRLLSYLVLPSSQATDVLWAARKAVQLVVATYAERAGQPRPLSSPFYPYWACLPGVILTELAKVDKVRQAALQALNELLEVVVPGTATSGTSGGGGAVDGDDDAAADLANCSLWNGPLRDTLARKLQPSTKSPETAAAATAAVKASQSLQHLADLATATVSSSAADDGKAADGAGTATGASTRTLDEEVLRGVSHFEDLGFDPTQLLRGGYLNAVQTTPSLESPSAQPPQAIPSSS